MCGYKSVSTDVLVYLLRHKGSTAQKAYKTHEIIHDKNYENLWLTSCFHIMRPVGQNQIRRYAIFGREF